MAKVVCPGQDTRFWKPGDIFNVKCSRCGNLVEFFKDEATRRCPKCGKRIVNPKLSLGCAKWCAHAKECLGFDPKEIDKEIKEASLADRVVDILRGKLKKGAFQGLLLALSSAEDMLKWEKDVDPKTLILSVLLYHVEDNDLIKTVLDELEIDNLTKRDVLEIVQSLKEEKNLERLEFKLAFDALKIEDMAKTGSFDNLDVLKTESGKKSAKNMRFQKI